MEEEQGMGKEILVYEMIFIFTRIMLILEERGIPRSKPNGVSVCGEVWLFLLSSNSEIEGRLCTLLFDLETMLCFQRAPILPKNTIKISS